MFALRRAAARAVFTQPSRQLSSLGPASRISPFQLEKPTLIRSFHQSWRWLAEEKEKPVEASPAEAETSDETVTTEPSETELKEIRSEKFAAPDAVESAEQSAESASENVQEKAQETVQEAKSTASNVVEQAQQFASSAAQTVQNAASSASQTARQQFPPRNSGSSIRAGRDVQPGRILYIGNLFFEVTTGQLESEFGKYGEITNSRVVTDSRGLSKGFGYIEFATQDAADAAVRELDQRVFQGRRMAVQYHVRREPRNAAERQRSQNPPSKTLFIGNMSYQMSDRDLNDLFNDVRNVVDVRVAIDRRSGQPRGFAHADFIDVQSAQRAKEQLESKVIYGRQLRLDYGASSDNRTMTS